MPKVKSENTFYRDGRLSLLHREWGINCLATDIDLVLLEYSFDRRIVTPAAIIEYKKERVAFDPYGAQCSAIRTLANKADLPFFIARYSDDLGDYQVTVMNQLAKNKFGALKERKMSEYDYVEFLYALHKKISPPQEVIDGIKKRDEARKAGLDVLPYLYADTTGAD